jgi:hypothetical protein
MVFRYGYSMQFSKQLAPEMGMAVIANPKVIMVISAMKMAEKKPTCNVDFAACGTEFDIGTTLLC